MSRRYIGLQGKLVVFAMLLTAMSAPIEQAGAQQHPISLFSTRDNNASLIIEDSLITPNIVSSQPLFGSHPPFSSIIHQEPPKSVSALLERATELLHADSNEALRIAHVALTQAKQTQNQSGEARSLSTIGDAYAIQGKLPQALRAHLHARELYEQLGDVGGIARAFGDIGHVYRRQDNSTQAVHYAQRAARLYETLDSAPGLATAYHNLGVALSDVGAYAEAIPYLRHALSFAEEIDHPHKIAVASNNMGVALNHAGQYTEALRYHHRALSISEEIGFESLSAVVCDRLGRAYLALGRLDLALTFAERSLGLAKQVDDVYYMNSAHEVLALIHAAQGEYERAYNYRSRYSVIRDSLFNADRGDIISQMQTRHEMEGMEQQLENLRQRNHIDRIQTRQRQNLLLGGLGALILITGFSFTGYRLKQRANRLLSSTNKTIEQQKETLRGMLREKEFMLEEKDILVKEIHHRVKNNLQLLSSMLRLQVQTLEHPTALTALQDVQTRVLSMALLHRELYGEDNSTHVDMQGYIEKLSQLLLRAFNANGRVYCPVKAHGIQLNADTAMPLGLILNELLSNALKHAFPDERQGVIKVELHKLEDDGWYDMTVSDNGIGCSERTSSNKTATIGLTMIKVMTHQLRGAIQCTNCTGLTYDIRFKAKEIQV